MHRGRLFCGRARIPQTAPCRAFAVERAAGNWYRAGMACERMRDIDREDRFALSMLGAGIARAPSRIMCLLHSYPRGTQAISRVRSGFDRRMRRLVLEARRGMR